MPPAQAKGIVCKGTRHAAAALDAVAEALLDDRAPLAANASRSNEILGKQLVKRLPLEEGIHIIDPSAGVGGALRSHEIRSKSYRAIEGPSAGRGTRERVGGRCSGPRARGGAGAGRSEG